jgi:predicted dienelactone hydrolase
MRGSDRIGPPVARRLGVRLALGILNGLLVTGAKGGPPQARFNVGYRVLDLKCQKDGQEEVLTVAVWYPTAAWPKPYNYGGPTRGCVAVDAAPGAEGGPYPLLLFSHGYGGSGISAVFFTEALASHGWIVAAPDHHDRHSAVRIRTGPVKGGDRRGLLQYGREIAASGPGDRGKFLYRLDEMQCVLDGLLASDQFGKLIDKDRIAVGGHSFGGFTALGLCGTIAERHDARIRAVLLFSTGAGGYLFTEAELAAVKMPSMLHLGERERARNQKRGKHTMAELTGKIYASLSPPKYMLEIKDAGHFSFNNCFDETPRARGQSGAEEQHEVIRRYSIAFLEKYVAGRKDLDRVLDRNDPLLTRHITETVADVSKQDEETRRGAERDAPADADKPRR